MKLSIFCNKSAYKVYHQLEADAPVKHDISLMASFLCQAIFYVSFFSNYLMPLINFVMLLGVILLWYIEKRTFMKHSLVKDSLDMNNINMIYMLALYGFIFSQALSIGNIKIIIKYFNNPSMHELGNLLQVFFDYGIISLIIGVTIFFRNYYSTKKITKRILQYLSKLEKKGEINIRQAKECDGDKEKDMNTYMKLNPYYKLLRDKEAGL